MHMIMISAAHHTTATRRIYTDRGLVTHIRKLQSKVEMYAKYIQ